jgi:hypothetical protein
MCHEQLMPYFNKQINERARNLTIPRHAKIRIPIFCWKNSLERNQKHLGSLPFCQNPLFNMEEGEDKNVSQPCETVAIQFPPMPTCFWPLSRVQSSTGSFGWVETLSKHGNRQITVQTFPRKCQNHSKATNLHKQIF